MTNADNDAHHEHHRSRSGRHGEARCGTNLTALHQAPPEHDGDGQEERELGRRRAASSRTACRR